MKRLNFRETNSEREKILRLFRCTPHAKKRMRQREIRRCDIRQAFEYGRDLYYDGLLFFALDCDSIPDGKDHVLIDELEGVVVLIDPYTYEVITVYRNPNAIPNIERKIKYWSGTRKSRKKGVTGTSHH